MPGLIECLPSLLTHKGCFSFLICNDKIPDINNFKGGIIYLSFFFFFKIESHFVAQAGIKFDPPP
jgi:hypothetical protein